MGADRIVVPGIKLIPAASQEAYDAAFRRDNCSIGSSDSSCLNLGPLTLH